MTRSEFDANNDLAKSGAAKTSSHLSQYYGIGHKCVVRRGWLARFFGV